MMKSVRAFLTACFMSAMLPAVSYGAIAPPNHTVSVIEEEREDSIEMIEGEPIVDDSGNVTVTVFVADDVAFPVTMLMKGCEGRLSLTITYDGQSIKMKPGTYRLTKVTDGNGKRLDSSASFTIPEEGGEVYFDFHKPDDADGSTVKQFLLSNLLFVPMALFLYACCRWYETNFLH